MSKTKTDIILEYEHIPTPDATERIDKAWEIIVALILEDYQIEQEENAEELMQPALREGFSQDQK